MVFGTVLLDPANPDFTILGRPLVDVLVLGSLVVMHGVALVMLVKPSGRLVSTVARGDRWRAQLVAAGTFLAMALTALGAVSLVARATGWAAPVTVLLVLCAAGLHILDPHRTRPIALPALRVMGAIALGLLTISGTVGLVDAVTTIV